MLPWKAPESLVLRRPDRRTNLGPDRPVHQSVDDWVRGEGGHEGQEGQLAGPQGHLGVSAEDLEGCDGAPGQPGAQEGPDHRDAGEEALLGALVLDPSEARSL